MTEQKRALITGGAGFIGSHLCERLHADGVAVIAMDNLLTGDLSNIEHLFGRKDFVFAHQDVTNFIHVPGLLDYLLHSDSPASSIDDLELEPTNIGNPREMTMLDFAEAVKAATGSSAALTFKPLPQKDPKQRKPDIVKAQRVLGGLEPKGTQEEGLQRTFAYSRKKLGDRRS